MQFGLLASGKKMKKFNFIIWHTVVWSLWFLQNEIIFKNSSFDLLALLDMVKICSWTWFH